MLYVLMRDGLNGSWTLKLHKLMIDVIKFLHEFETNSRAGYDYQVQVWDNNGDYTHLIESGLKRYKRIRQRRNRRRRR